MSLKFLFVNPLFSHELAYQPPPPYPTLRLVCKLTVNLTRQPPPNDFLEYFGFRNEGVAS